MNNEEFRREFQGDPLPNPRTTLENVVLYIWCDSDNCIFRRENNVCAARYNTQETILKHHKFTLFKDARIDCIGKTPKDVEQL